MFDIQRTNRHCADNRLRLKSVTLGRIQLDDIDPFQKPFDFTYTFVQTLTTLNLAWNDIHDEGAEHLAQVLQNNTVKQVLFGLTVYSPFCINTDTHHAQTWVERNRG